MTTLLTIGSLGGCLGLSVFAVLYALSVRSGSRSIVKVGDLTRDLDQAKADLVASVEQRHGMALTLARQLREIRELQDELANLAHLLPTSARDAITARLDRMLSPPSTQGNSSDVSRSEAGTAPESDIPSPVPSWYHD